MAKLKQNKRSDETSIDQPELCSLLHKRIDNDMISYVAQIAAKVVQCNLDSTTIYTKDVPPLPPLKAFISHLVMRSGISTPTFLTSLVYLTRIKSQVPPSTIGFRCASHRIFLISLILADKYVNDVHYTNSSWSEFSILSWKGHCFGFLTSEITASERHLLSLLEYNVRIAQDDLQEQLLPLA
jgi:hypothetical protein